MVQRVMGRSRYSATEEQEAEVMAGVIVQRAGRMFAAGSRDVVDVRDEATSSMLGRLSTALVGE